MQIDKRMVKRQFYAVSTQNGTAHVVDAIAPKDIVEFCFRMPARTLCEIPTDGMSAFTSYVQTCGYCFELRIRLERIAAITARLTK